jgi:hypothetical protein
MKARFVKTAKMRELASKIKDNIELYRTGKFDGMSNDPEYYFESEVTIDEELLKSVFCTDSDLNEVDSCIKAFHGIGAVSEYLARDERLWVYLTHTLLLDYARTRWPIPTDPEKAEKHIRTHFFCSGARGIERDNAASRLWWMASLCNRCSDMPLKDSLACFLHQSDVRANIIERPTTSQNVRIFNAILKRLHESLYGDKSLYGREKFRLFMKYLNLQGGVKLLAALPDAKIEEIMEYCVAASA